ncbi:glycosyl hydrolase family 3 N terminal domain-containing protein [Colletotrichum chrysophilum]|uniref:beta-glucosidase n=1 Tax=Colletotrichum chrysophilum TaxID=1836956 RepID=A0AAD8ZYE5_9PEZI|nr:glycosyl hydrolase family 3 N terminal domain-containing protein [Colletotrichum chrysophilum]
MSRLPYKDQALPVDQRVEDLLQRMTLAEKAGLLFHDMIRTGPGGSLRQNHDATFGIPPTEELISVKMMNHFNLLGPITNVRETAQWHNHLQKRAMETRLGIPITVSTDPRHHFADNFGTGCESGCFSQWPESLGLAALRSPELVERFADIARQEYIAVGLRLALHPQVDLSTEPRWSRIGATFGEDADLSSQLVESYIRGFQGPSLGPHSVATVTKHFPGGGPQKDGEDPHFSRGKDQIYPGANFEYHLRPFVAAIAVGAAQIMPYYGRPVGTKYPEIGFAFNKSIITGLLREKLGFTGTVCTDWGLVTDKTFGGEDIPARAWGVEHLSEVERVQTLLEAGCDQCGGETRPELVVQLVETGRIPESRIDVSARRILRQKFMLGLFENPFIDIESAVRVVGSKDFVHAGKVAQRSAFTLLTNHSAILPLANRGQSIYVEGINSSVLSSRGLTVTSTPAEADLALLRLKAPYEKRPGFFESMFHSGSLEFSNHEKRRQRDIMSAIPTIVDIYLDRPAVIPDLALSAAALLASFGSDSDAFLDIVFGKASPKGRLPFDLPSTTKSVEESRTDVPYDTTDPLFRFGHGLSY